MLQEQQESLSRISIPSGTIKSIILKGMMQNVSEFQFLLVRLKAWTMFYWIRSINISIPSGTIKRLKFDKGQLHNRLISIPSGTIKR